MSGAFGTGEEEPVSQLQPCCNSLELHPHRDVDQQNQIISVKCCRRTVARTAITVLSGVMTATVLWLFALWYVKFRAWLMFERCSPEDATHYLVTSSDSVEIVRRVQKTTKQGEELTTFTYRLLHYEVRENDVYPLIFDTEKAYSSFYSELGNGYSDESTLKELQTLYGSSKLEIPEPSLCSLLITEFLTPFVLFQCYSIGLWCYEMYFWYAIAIFLLTVVSVITSLIETKRNISRVRTLAGKSFNVTVIRNEKEQEIDSGALVHGDVVIVPEKGSIPCDLVLISGGAVMKESMLTGESIPVIKDPIPNQQNFTYDFDKDKLYTLYHGTETLQAIPEPGQQYVKAVAVRTGFHTFKGKLIRSILFSKLNRFWFSKESTVFIILLIGMTIVGFLITLQPMLESPVVEEDVIVRCLDLITIAVPPLLPTAMAVGAIISTIRLKRKNIYCISPAKINIAGKVGYMVFDKTGTLTQDGMMQKCVILAENLRECIESSPTIQTTSPLFFENLVCCHSLRYVDGTSVGDSMDIAIFQGTGWKMRDGRSESVQMVLTSPTSDREIKLEHIFHFDSAMKRMGVVIEEQAERRFHVKGAPEIISALCNQATVPENLNQVVNQYTCKGLRVIACASGPVPLDCTREVLKTKEISTLEENLQFLGLVVLENKLKPESERAIAQLKSAMIPCVMATGDASLTGLAVAMDCGIIENGFDVFMGDCSNGNAIWTQFSATANADANEDGDIRSPSDRSGLSRTQISVNEDAWLGNLMHSGFALVVTGELFKLLVLKATNGKWRDKVVLRGCLEHARVYARMAPEDKLLLVEQLKTTGVHVGMCGDGANDCSALKAADIGVSLSQTEASIAAPFTSKIENISAVLTILREGRCVLATSFMSFKYMALYSMIQFSSVCILFWWGSYLGNMQFLFSDVFIVLPLVLFMCWAEASSELCMRIPGDTLLSLPVLYSVVGNGLLCFASQLLAWGLAREQPWFHTVDIEATDTEEGMKCFENSVVWLTSNVNYLTVALMFNTGKPFRRAPYTNIPFVVWFLWIVSVCTCLILDPPQWVREFLFLTDMERDFKGKLLGINVAYIAACVLYEKGVMWVIDIMHFKKKHQCRRRRAEQEMKFEDNAER